MKARRGKPQQGNALLEFAIGWPVLWLIFAGVYEFGYSFYVYNALQLAVANAAELGSQLDYDVGDTGNPTSFQAKLQNMVVYGDEAAGTAPIVPGLTTANVNVAAALSLAGIGPDRTMVEIWADPGIDRNCHSIEVDSDAARLRLSIENVPSENPKTGRITALSVVAALRKLHAPLRVGT